MGRWYFIKSDLGRRIGTPFFKNHLKYTCHRSAAEMATQMCRPFGLKTPILLLMPWLVDDERRMEIMAQRGELKGKG